jgi:endonuclease/exonuclease/phosphatase family metal-dependent hydrolase
MKLFLSFIALFTSFTAKCFTIGSYNIRNFDYDERHRIFTDKTELSSILQSLNVDILSVEEINNTFEWTRFVQTKMPGYATQISKCGGAHGQRLGFLYNKNSVELLSFHEDLAITAPGTSGKCDDGTRPLAIGLFRIKSTGQKFYGLTAHLKSGGQSASIIKRTKQYQIIKEVILELKSKTGIQDFFLAGDLNTTEFLNKGPDFIQLNKIVSDLGMKNLTANLKCTAYFWGGTDDGIESPSMLDHVVVTPGLLKFKGSVSAIASGHCQKVGCKQVSISELGASYEGVSDHCPITATIQ